MKKDLLFLFMSALPFIALAEVYPTTSYTLSEDGLTLTKWTGDETIVDMNSDELLSKVTTIGDYSCTTMNFEKFIVGNNVTAIGNGAFLDCTKLSDLSLPEGLLSLGRAAFSTCSSLPAVVLPSSLTTLGASSFYGCTSLKSVEIPVSVTDIPAGCFNGCSALSAIGLPDGIRSVGEEAFKGCVSLKSFVCPSALKLIDGYAFQECEALASVSFNPGLEEISGYAFDASGLESADFSGSTTTISFGFNLFQNCTKLASVLLPPVVGNISSGLFLNCSSIKEIVIPDSYTEIPVKMCQGCKGLEKVTFGENVSTIKNTAFFECGSLKEILFNDRLETIDWNVFYGCSSLENVSLPASFKSADDYLFADCVALKRVECAAVVPPALGVSAFSGVNLAEATLCVPAESIEAYKAADQWMDFGTFDGVTSIEAVGVDSTMPQEIYDLYGRRMPGMDTLRPGLYIIRTSDTSGKVLVK